MSNDNQAIPVSFIVPVMTSPGKTNKPLPADHGSFVWRVDQEDLRMFESAFPRLNLFYRKFECVDEAV